LRCGECGAENPAGKRFCADCGGALSTPCPACGAATEPGRRFCGDCGSPLTVTPTPPAVPVQQVVQPVAERRVCSVLFCDLVGFTPLSESRDPEEVRELLSRYFDLARTVIGRYGGVVEKFIGDAVMAVWGTPVAGEADAERAVRAALDVVESVAQMGVEAGVSGLAARAGVVTGEVAVTLGASNEGMVAGDAVNTAARVQAAATSGQVLVDSTTRRLVASSVGFEDAGERALKGKAEPEQLWRAIRVLSGVGGAQRVDGLEAPLTGRDAELRLLRELFHAAAERRLPRMVVVTGPAGVGKSRLGWEFEKYIDGLKGTVWWHRGRCLSYGDGVSFWALAEVVRQRLGIAEEDPPELGAIKLAEGLRTYAPDAGEHEYIGVRLARLLGIPYPGDAGQPMPREELFAGWRLFFERLAEALPVVVVIEDIQYADSGLLDFLDNLIDWTRDQPIFVVAFGRPEFERDRPGFGAGRNRTALTLDPLDSASMEILLEALVPGMPPAAAEAINNHAQGIPLFAVETVRSLIDRDVVQPIEGSYRLVGEVGELAVPDSLHALLAARLDALAPDVRRLVADAAVLGSSFPAEALIAVSGQDEPAVREALAELVRREVFDVRAEPLSPQRGEYRFAQEMLRQVAYETLSRRDRKQRHLAVASHLRSSFANDGEEVSDVIAFHYLDALAAVPDDPDLEQIRDEAISVLIRSSERAARTGAPTRAATSYAAAAGLIEEAHGASDPRAADLHLKAASAAYLGADYERARTSAEDARRIFAGLGDDRGVARAMTGAGQALRRSGRLLEAREQLTGAVTILSDPPDVDTVQAMGQLAALENQAGSPEADRLSRDALTLGESLAVDLVVIAELFVTRGLWSAAGGYRLQACAFLRESARIAEQLGETALAGRALLNLADVLNTYDPTAGVEAARLAVARARRAGDGNGHVVAVTNLAGGLIAIGEWDEAREVLFDEPEQNPAYDLGFHSTFQVWFQALCGDADLHAAYEEPATLLQSSEDSQDLSMFAAMRAYVAAAQGQPAEALAAANEALSHIGVLGVAADTIRWAWPLAIRLAFDLGDLDAVRDLLRMVDGRQPGEFATLMSSERTLARARLAAADHEPDADRQFAVALEVMRARSTPYHLGFALVAHARFLEDNGEPARAIEAVEEARAIGDRLGCRPLLDAADQVLATSAAQTAATIGP
jgi:class 3 adenylate cyclase/tetratricopeptide (TPR) repeat protein